MCTVYQKIRSAIERSIELGKRNFIIYPYGEYGFITKQVLNDCFGIKEEYIIDNYLYKFNSNIKELDFCKDLERNRYTILFTCANPDVYDEVLQNLKQYFEEYNIVEIFKKEPKIKNEEKVSIMGEDIIRGRTKRGRSSYGPLCDHYLVESVGAFCSFAPGTDVVENHAIEYISTHPFLYYGGVNDNVTGRTWEDVEGEPGYFEGVCPKGNFYKTRKIKIGNDVWLGENVLITNGSNIGNGVIAGAGAIITKDVPDYAVVMGVPAHIVRYRYTKAEIDALNRIAWWNWTDEKIRENYEDFYLDIKDFILKHDIMENTNLG